MGGNLIVVDRTTEIGEVVTTYNELDKASRDRLLGYMLALREEISNMKTLKEFISKSPDF